MAEILDIVDEEGIPTGEVVDRNIAHSLGILHRTAHVWLLREKDDNIQVLLQKRSQNKDSFPDCFDISSAGHIPAGVDYISSALRELKEELGYEAKPDDLIYCGTRRFFIKENFHGKNFLDNQISNVYMIWVNKKENEFVLQKEEVSEVQWFDFYECMKNVEQNRFSHCIYLEELLFIKNKVESLR